MSGGSRLTEDAISLSDLESVAEAGDEVMLSFDSMESDCGFSRLEKSTDEADGGM